MAMRSSMSAAALSQHRLGPALAFFVQSSTLALCAVVLGTPILLLLFLLIARYMSLGLCASSYGLSMPPDVLLRWRLRWRRVPCSALMAFFLDLPITLLMLLHLALGCCLLYPAAHLARELRAALLHRRPVPLAHDPEAPCDDSTVPATTEPSRLYRPSRPTRRPSLEEGSRYRTHTSAWAALEGDGHTVERGDVRLISLAWLMKLGSEGGVLSRRQDLPPEAFIEADQLRAIAAGTRASSTSTRSSGTSSTTSATIARTEALDNFRMCGESMRALVVRACDGCTP